MTPELRRDLLWLMPPTLAGLFLRLWRVGEQVLGGDELHALRALLRMDLGEILTTYQSTDFCQPLTALYRLLELAGAPLTELTFRLPVLCAAVLTPLLLPLAVRRYLDRSGTVVFAWLLALSPLLVLYGRMVRSYGIIVLVGFSAAMAFWRWLQHRRRRDAVLYAVLAALGVYFHLGTAPLLAAPFAFALGLKLLRPRESPTWVALVSLGLATLAALAAFLLPAWHTLGTLIEEKSGAAEVDPSTLLPTLEQQAGTARLPLALGVWLLAVAGVAVLWRRQRPFALFGLALAAVHVVGLLVLAPQGLGSVVVLNRYFLVLTPWLLLWVAAGVTALAGERAWLRVLLPAATLAVLTLAGPFADPAYRGSSFVHHPDFLNFHAPLAALPAGAVPQLYRQMAAAPEPGAVIEMPVSTTWRRVRAPYVYQQVHHRRVIAANYDPVLCDARLSLHNRLCPSPDALLATGARYLVVHRDEPAEESALVLNAWMQLLAGESEAEARQQVQTRRLALALRRLWGRPDAREGGLMMWDLERVRRRLARSAG